jgi:phosphoglycolate phosphatase-like HAD superfamily hydrolase
MVIVFDIDGTLANNDHRSHWIASNPKNWRASDLGIPDDSTYEDIVWLLNTFLRVDCTILLCSGRSEDTRTVTEDWLSKHSIKYTKLYMRSSKDYRKDSIVKVELLYKIIEEFGKPYLWIDDRQQVVDALRDQGIRVLQVAPGDF